MVQHDLEFESGRIVVVDDEVLEDAEVDARQEVHAQRQVFKRSRRLGLADANVLVLQTQTKLYHVQQTVQVRGRGEIQSRAHVTPVRVYSVLRVHTRIVETFLAPLAAFIVFVLEAQALLLGFLACAACRSD